MTCKYNAVNTGKKNIGWVIMSEKTLNVNLKKCGFFKNKNLKPYQIQKAGLRLKTDLLIIL